MRRMAATVTIISACSGEGPRGMTATAVAPVSMEPLSVLVAINRRASIHGSMRMGALYCINVLHAGQHELAAMFGSPERWAERFAGDDWDTSEDGLPYLPGAQANIFCRQAGSWEHGTHSIIVGDIVRMRVANAVDPLLYADGAYRALAQPVGTSIL